MTKEQSQNIFIANQIYPDAQSIFSFSNKSIDVLKDECYIVVDTNVLLVPYTVHPKSLAEIAETYRSLAAENRLIVPGQVAREFAKNRAGKISELYQQLSRKRDKDIDLKLESYPLLEEIEDFQNSLKTLKELKNLVKQYKEKLGNVLDQIKNWSWNDPVSLIYRDIFSGDVIFDLPLEDQAKLHEELSYRQLHKLPPGYKDAAKSDQGIGDFLIWKTILRLGEIHKKSVIFVSLDQKADWWYQSEKQALYPRYELVDEFRRISDGQSFQIITFSQFLKLYGASKEVVEEVLREEVSESEDDCVAQLRELSHGNLFQELELIISDYIGDMVEDVTISSKIAETNASSWSIDEFDIDDVEFSPDECLVRVSYKCFGEQSDEQFFVADELVGEADVTINQYGDVNCRVLSCEIKYPDD
jgi:rRNA-processing protein FCF1